MIGDERSLTVIVVPHGGGTDAGTRTYELSARTVRRLRIGAVVAGVLLLAVLGSWLYFFAQAARVQMLQRSVRKLEAQVAQTEELRRQLVEAELRTEQIRKLLGGIPRRGGAAPPAGGAPAPAGGDSAAADSAQASLPRAWPLAVRGFITRGQQRDRTHPGMDIAVPAGTPIVAAGDGTVTEAGSDSVYGLFVRVAHRNGYESLYGHASRVLVKARQRVRRRQTIALSGSTGVSSAPHLHFEIRRNGVPVDPVTLVQLPE